MPTWIYKLFGVEGITQYLLIVLICTYTFSNTLLSSFKVLSRIQSL